MLTRTRIEEGTVQCHTGKYVLKNRTVLALLLTGFDKLSIFQYRLFGFVLSSFDPVLHQDSAVVVVSLLSAVMSKQLNMIEGNEGKENAIIPKNQQV